MSYRRYDSSTEGFGSPRQWRAEFASTFTREEAAEILATEEDSPYVILGVETWASEKEIKAAYRRLAMKWHPDMNPGNEEIATARMKLINAAYTILTDK